MQVNVQPGKVHSKGVVGSTLPSGQVASVTLPVKLGPHANSQLLPAKTLWQADQSKEQGVFSGTAQVVWGTQP